MAKATRSKRKRAAASSGVEMSTGEATVTALLAHGLDTIYALPGVHNDHLFDALHGAADRIRTLHTRHKQGVAYMTLGAALATGKLQAYAVVPGPGLLNFAAALLTAYSRPSQLRAALRRALIRREPSLIEVPTGPLPSPWQFIHMPRIRGRQAVCQHRPRLR
ncbi:MAG: thiamine pyrophosphate-binding protein [Pseudolabrys sp.]